MKFYVYLHLEEKEVGPFAPEEVIEQLYDGAIQWTDAIREANESSWKTMSDIFELEEL